MLVLSTIIAICLAAVSITVNSAEVPEKRIKTPLILRLNFNTHPQEERQNTIVPSNVHGTESAYLKEASSTDDEFGRREENDDKQDVSARKESSISALKILNSPSFARKTKILDSEFDPQTSSDEPVLQRQTSEQFALRRQQMLQSFASYAGNQHETSTHSPLQN